MKTFTKSEIEFLKTNALSFGAIVCAKKLNRSLGSVISKLKREKILYKHKTDKSETEINNIIFIENKKKIVLDFKNNGKELAYFLGFFWADGTINREDFISIEILKNDGAELLPIFEKIADFKISYRKRKNRQEQMTFSYSDKEIASILKNLGKYPHSKESHKKILDYIPSEYHLYFLRGLIDGDGCFYKGKKYSQFTIGGSLNQDWSTIINLLESFNVNSCAVKRYYKNYTSSILRVTGKENLFNLIKILYQDLDDIYLKRKKNKAFEIIETYNNNSKLNEKHRKKYSIRYSDGTEVVINNLKKFAKDNGFCYECLNKAANNSGKYKNINIRKL